MTLKTLRTVSISFLLTLVRLATEKEIPQVNQSPSFYLTVNYAESIYLSVTSHEIWTFIGSMNVRKSSGPCSTSVPAIVLKFIRDYISKPLAFLVNDSFTSGNFPDKLKLARITPIFKKGSRFDKDSSRPISFLSNFCKIIEKALYHRLYRYLEDFKILRVHFCLAFEKIVNPGVNVIKVLHLYFTRVAIVSLAENNSCTCKLQVKNFYKLDPCMLFSQSLNVLAGPLITINLLVVYLLI